VTSAGNGAEISEDAGELAGEVSHGELGVAVDAASGGVRDEDGNQQVDEDSDGGPGEEGNGGPGEVVDEDATESASVDAAEVPAEAIEPEQSGQLGQPGQPGLPDLVDQRALRAAVEAILFVVESPVTAAALASALRKPTGEIEAALAELTADLDARASGVELRDVAGGVRLYTRPEFASWVEAFLLDGQRTRLTQAALETLAVIAYRQPVTRARISAIRGVNVDGVVRTLTTRGLITEVGADPDTGGGLYRTTEAFLEKMGMRSLDELPSLAPLLPELDGVESDEL
jgi:segregation and condensation protein B